MQTETDPDRPRRCGRPRRLNAKDDPRYQPTQAELEEDIGIPGTTPEELARMMFSETRTG